MERTIRPGGSIVIPAGTPHGFKRRARGGAPSRDRSACAAARAVLPDVPRPLARRPDPDAREGPAVAAAPGRDRDGQVPRRDRGAAHPRRDSSGSRGARSHASAGCAAARRRFPSTELPDGESRTGDPQPGDGRDRHVPRHARGLGREAARARDGRRPEGRRGDRAHPPEDHRALRDARGTAQLRLEGNESDGVGRSAAGDPGRHEALVLEPRRRTSARARPFRARRPVRGVHGVDLRARPGRQDEQRRAGRSCCRPRCSAGGTSTTSRSRDRPSFVQRLLYALLAPIARARGYRDRYPG